CGRSYYSTYFDYW
nr:immunoglobulin heavy chain junction region [Mus musculus]MBK4190091.1 immunoglobulin heavy chain junction region [Mus musculus]